MNGVYGNRKPAIIDENDIEIYYFYRPNRSMESNDFKTWKKLDSNILVSTKREVETDGTPDTVLPGVYNLKLPLDKFSQVGIYNIYIKPKEIKAKILDVSTLAAYSNVRGIVLDTTDMTEQLSDFSDNGLVGYRVEYFDGNNKRTGEFRIITSNNRCEPVSQNLNNGFTKGITYNFNSSSNLMFCTLTPSASMSYNSSSVPFIGKIGDTIALVNTKFNPVLLEVEMTDKDINSIVTMLEGRQLRNLTKGTITTFNENGGIFHQASYGNIVNGERGIHHEYKLPNGNNIDFDEARILKEIEDNI